jgi:hypothetical protein
MTSPQIRERTDGLRSAKFPVPVRKQYLPRSGEHQLSLLLKTRNRKKSEGNNVGVRFAILSLARLPISPPWHR